jgi:creatinine amidohydrolase
VELPSDHKAPVDLAGRDDISPVGFREAIGDGSFGGWYQRPDDEMEAIWEIAVLETRALISEGWAT